MTSVSDINAVINGCPEGVDHSDPLAVAGAAARWLSCATGPPGVLSLHARQVVARRVAAGGPPPRAVRTTLFLLDPRAAPVVVYAVVRSSGDVGGHGVVLTLFADPHGDWVVDDVAVLGP